MIDLPPRVRRFFRLPWRSAERIRDDVDEEIAFHLDMRTEELVSEGMDRREARERAEREFGDVGRARRELRGEDRRIERRARWTAWLDGVRQELRSAVRTLRTRPGFAAVVVFTLALGIGANTAVFGMVRAVLLRPLAFAEPDRLVGLWERHPQRGIEKNPVSTGNYMDWRDRAESFEDIAAYSGPFGLALTGGERPEHVTGRSVAPGLFRVLGVEAALGRTLGPPEVESGAANVVVISHGLWQRRFGGDPEVVGRTLRINEAPYRIVGVMPASFRFPTAETQLWMPRVFDEDDRSVRNAHPWLVVGRLAGGAAIERARDEMDAIARRLGEEHPEFVAGWRVHVVPFREDLAGDARPALLALLGAAGLVLLITCANVANLLLARAMARRRESAVRAALGAGRARLIRQSLLESMVLAALGGAAGLLLGLAAMDVLVAVGPPDLPMLDETRADPTVLAFSVAATVLSGLLFGLIPALRVTGGRLRDALADAAARGTGRRDRRARGMLLVGEVALCVVLLVGAGLLVRTFGELSSVDYGYAPDRLLAASLDLGSSRYAETGRQVAFMDRLVDRVEALPGVAGVAASSEPPVVGYQFQFSFLLEGRPRPGPDPRQDDVYVQAVTPASLQTLGLTLVRGRGIEPGDREGARRVAVINRELARRVFDEEDPIGHRVSFGGDSGPWFEIVGVVGDTRYYSLDSPPQPTLYLAFAQKPWPWLTAMTLLVRTEGDPAAWVPSVRREVLALDGNLPLERAVAVPDLYAESLARRRFVLVLLAGFAAVAVLLGAVGLYGVLAYGVTQRRREIGVRIALGAGRTETTAMVLRQGLRLTLAGIAIGTLVALLATRLLSTLLYGVSARDPVTFVAATALLIGVAAIACWLPARRATRVDPMAALRAE